MHFIVATFSRSLRTRILLVHFATLVVALGAFLFIEGSVGLDADRVRMRQLFLLQVDGAIRAYEAGGPGELSQFLKRLDRSYTSTHYLLDPEGRDLVSGTVMHPTLSPPSNAGSLVTFARRVFGIRRTFVVRSPDRRYQLLYVDAEQWQNVAAQLPYYLLVLVVTAAVYLYLAVGMAMALTTVSSAAERFGEGDLDARVPATARRDEVGNLARSFNAMADQIATLLVAERRLLQDVSHELRSPLARLSFAVELSRTAVNRDAAHAHVKRELDLMTALVASLVEVTRAEGDPVAHKMERLAVDEILRTVVDSCAVDVDASRRHIRVTMAAAPIVRGNRELLRRAFDNVLRNAICHSPAGSEIAVVLREEHGRATIEVRDQGDGVPDALLERIFSPFYRIDEGRPDAAGGVGLGLSIVRRVVELHQGTATARNAHPGLCVTLTLPMSTTGPDPAPVERPRSESAPGSELAGLRGA